jgi:hypothetical protein
MVVPAKDQWGTNGHERCVDLLAGRAPYAAVGGWTMHEMAHVVRGTRVERAGEPEEVKGSWQ